MSITSNFAITIAGSGLPDDVVRGLTESTAAQLVAAGANMTRARFEVEDVVIDLAAVEKQRAALVAESDRENAAAVARDEERIIARDAAELAALVAERAKDSAVAECRRFYEAQLAAAAAAHLADLADLRDQLAHANAVVEGCLG